MVINSKFLEVPRSYYQRHLNASRVKRIAAEFDERIANAPKVSYRDGHYYVFDGQHTIAARKLLNNNSDLNIVCKVYSGLTEQEEALLFAQQTGISAPLTAGAKLRAKIHGGDPEAIAFQSATQRAGFGLSFNQSHAKWKIACIATAFGEYARVSIPMAILIWVMIYPMMMKVDFRSIKNVGKNPKGLFVTWIVNWLIKPFTMYGMASLFFFVVFKAFITPELATEYLAGAVLLGAAPCTAMVFVWSALTKGDPAYTVVQVATNDLIILVAFVPIVKFLLGVSNVFVPWDTLILSVVLFVVIPLAGGMLTRYFVTQKKGAEYFENTFVKKFDGITTIGLLLTLVLIFAFQGQVILDNPLHIVLIAIPLVLQTFLIFSIAYGVCWLLKLPHRIAAPAGMIGASNFFELAVAVAVALFGTTSPAALATTVGVLTEVPVMLFLVKIANKTKGRFPA